MHPSSDKREKEYVSVAGYKWSYCKSLLCGLISVCTGGIYLLCCYWVSYLWTISTKNSSDFAHADFILCKDLAGAWHECKARRIHLPDDTQILTTFEFRKIIYILNPTNEFEPQTSFSRPHFETIIPAGLTDAEVERNTLYYGPNVIDVPVKPLWRMALHKALEPFYIFQVFSCLVWYLEDPPYLYYATVIVVTSVASAAYEIWEQHSNTVRLRNLSRHVVSCEVLRAGKVCCIDSSDLVPGDVLFLADNSLVVADAALISGECIVDESMLTGESIPVVKQPLPIDLYASYHPDRHKANTLYCGSQLSVARASPHDQAKAVVVRTAFATSKGEMFRGIIFPKAIKFSFYRDAYIFLSIMGVIALAAFVQAVVTTLQAGEELDIFDCLDLITIAVPPALPLVLTVGTAYAVRRLNKEHIFCIDPDRVNLAGKIDLVCFDKTGTLTTDHLDFHSLRYVANSTIEAAECSVRGGMDGLKRVMVSCHGLARVKDKLVGPAVDRNMFAATAWDLIGPTDEQRDAHIVSVVEPRGDTSVGDAKVLIYRRFDFNATLQRSSAVVVDSSTGTMYAVCKGSPDAIRSVCAPNSVPASFEWVVNESSRAGYYVLACASRRLDTLSPAQIDSLTRQDVERDLGLDGLFMMENQLKPSTLHTIRALNDAHVRIRMLTGDSALTGISVARKSGMLAKHAKVLLIDKHQDSVVAQDVDSDYAASLEQLMSAKSHEDLTDVAVTGPALAHIQTLPAAYEWVLERATILARVLPQQKTGLVEAYMDRGFKVAMCGDGANDCGAMKAAHVGLSLSDAEASIVAPFTSRQKEPASVVTLLREGKCALSTSFAAFKYMSMYPIIQLLIELIQQHWGTGLNQYQYLWEDLAIVLPVAVTLCMTGPVEKLVRISPASSLFSTEVLGSLFMQLSFTFGFLALVLCLMWRSPWFCGIETYTLSSDGETLVAPDGCADMSTTGETQMSFENTVTFLFTNMQFYIAGLAISGGGPYRKPAWRNYAFVFASVLVVGLNMYMLIAYDAPQPFPPETTFNLTPALPMSFRLLILLVWCVAIMTCCTAEYVLQRTVAYLKSRPAPLQSVYSAPDEDPKKDAKAQLLPDAIRS